LFPINKKVSNLKNPIWYDNELRTKVIKRPLGVYFKG
jgi:hypothetical protein